MAQIPASTLIFLKLVQDIDIYFDSYSVVYHMNMILFQKKISIQFCFTVFVFSIVLPC